MLSLQTKKHKPPRIILYGVHGLGKSTFGSLAPSPVFIQTEDGLDSLDVPAFPLAKSFDEVMQYIGELAEQNHEFKTLVVDSVDWLEPLIWAQVCAEHNVKAIDEIGYGKGYGFALDIWAQYIDALNYLRDEKDMMIIQLAHSHVKRFENPETEAYDRYEMKLNVKAAGKLQEHSDIVLFGNYFTAVKKDKDGMKERKRAIGSGERILYTTERPAATAKNRYNLPSEIEFLQDGIYWNTIMENIPYFKNEDNNTKSS
jgi:hypothetical protein